MGCPAKNEVISSYGMYIVVKKYNVLRNLDSSC